MIKLSSGGNEYRFPRRGLWLKSAFSCALLFLKVKFGPTLNTVVHGIPSALAKSDPPVLA
jgi:hypothetical protein